MFIADNVDIGGIIMARKVKFALEMADGTKVRNSIEELREHFDMQSIASYYLSGKLLEWLEDRYYDDEAAKIEELDKDAPNLNAQLCAIIGVDASEFDSLDVEAVERLNEKKSILRQKTSDSTIIDNAMITALTQEDLADLLDLESPVIYLCGDKFNIPIRVEHKKYVGILGTPKIEIRATSDEDIKKKDIIFENVILPWQNLAKSEIASNVETVLSTPTNIQPVDEEFEMLKELYDNVFGNMKDRWMFVDDSYGSGKSDINLKDKITDVQKKICLKIVCKNKYDDSEIIHAHMNKTGSYGWMFTKDSFYIGGGELLQKIMSVNSFDKLKEFSIKYKDITHVEFEGYDGSMSISTGDGKYRMDWCGEYIIRWYGDAICEFLRGAANIMGDGCDD